MNIKYRPELDGLRALAVLVVIVYHAKLNLLGKSLLPGGFLGVDVFFVLSGFLITSIVRKSLLAGDFSFAQFYVRRLKRIVPALLIVLFASTLAAYYFLLPSELVKYTKSLVSAASFISNIYFYNEDPYTSIASELKPLLHTWSLSVEWQYYMIFPAILLALFRIGKKWILPALTIMLLASLFFANYKAQNDISYAFYMLNTRAWELISGGLCTWMPGRIRSKFFSELFSGGGLCLLIASFILFSDTIVHPSYLTIIPVIGTCFFIIGSAQSNTFSKFFQIKFIVYIGTISYSLYLWHQPIFAFYRVQRENISWVSFLPLTLLTFTLASISYVFVENIYRKKVSTSQSILFYFPLVSLLTVSCLVNVETNGLPSRLSPLARDMYENYTQPEFKRLDGPVGMKIRTESLSSSCTMRDPFSACLFGDGSVVVLGDSYAGSFTYALKNNLEKKGKGLIALDYEQCPFVTGLWFGNVAECPEINRRRWSVLKGIKNKKDTTILIATNYTQFSYPKKETKDPISDGKENITIGKVLPSEVAWESFKANITNLMDEGFNVVLIYPIPSVTDDVKNKFFNTIKTSNAIIQSNYYEKNTAGMIQAIELGKVLDRTFQDNKHLTKIRPVDIFCKTGRCEIITSKGALYNSGSHLSYTGVQTILDDLSI